MKKVLTAIVAFAITFSATATHTNFIDCTQKCCVLTQPALSVPTVLQQKIAALKHKTEEKKSQINYEKTMTGALRIIENIKWEQAKENLLAQGAYNQLMSAMFSKIKRDKSASEIEELEAEIRFEKLMASTFAK